MHKPFESERQTLAHGSRGQGVMETSYDDVFRRMASINQAVDAALARLRDGESDDETRAASQDADKLERWRQLTRKNSPRPVTWDSFIGNRGAVEQLQE